MKLLGNKKILYANILILAFIKLSLAYPTSGLVGLISDSPEFSKEEIVAETNFFRFQISQPALKANTLLDNAAAAKLSDMVARQYFAHISPQGIDPWYWFRVSGYKYTNAGENLAIGFFDAKDTIQAWADSPSHRKNMANPIFTEIGVAVKSTSIGDIKGTLVVQLFGTPQEQETVVASAVASLASLEPWRSGPKPAPSPTPVLKVSQAPTIMPQPSRENPILLAYVKDQIEPSPEPVINMGNGQFVTHSKTSRLSRLLNKGFIIYAGIFAALSLVSIALSLRRKTNWPIAALHIVIFLIALLIAPLSFSGTGFIL